MLHSYVHMSAPAFERGREQAAESARFRRFLGGHLAIAKQETWSLDNSHTQGTCTYKKCVGMLHRAFGNGLE